MGRPRENSKLRNIPAAVLNDVERVTGFYRANRSTEFTVAIMVNGREVMCWFSVDEATPEADELVTVRTVNNLLYKNVAYRDGGYWLLGQQIKNVKEWGRL